MQCELCKVEMLVLGIDKEANTVTLKCSKCGAIITKDLNTIIK